MHLHRSVSGGAIVAAVAAFVIGCASPSGDPAAVIARANQAMGTSNLKSIRYTADGTGYTFGQAFVPNAA